MKYTIEDLKNGICAVRNDGTRKELKKVLKLAFPEDSYPIKSLSNLYYGDPETGLWVSSDLTILPTQSVRDFLEEEWTPKWGEEVHIKNGTSRYTYIAKNPFNENHIVCNSLGVVFSSSFVEPLQKDLTIKEMSDKIKSLELEIEKLKK